MTTRATGRALWGGPGHSEMVTAQRECQGREGPGAFLEMPLGHLLGHRARTTLHIPFPSRGQDSSLHSAHGEDLRTGAPRPAPSQLHQTRGRWGLALEKLLNPPLSCSNV